MLIKINRSVSFWGDEKVLELELLWWCLLHNIADVLKATELYFYMAMVVKFCYVGFATIFKK